MLKIVEPKIVFEDPESYNFLPYVDHWEGRSKPIAFFLPAYYVDNDFKDQNGNTDIVAAAGYEVEMRKEKSKAANSSALDEYTMARPMIPSDMFLTPGSQIFPVQKLRDRLAEVERNNLFQIQASIGELEYKDKEKRTVQWIEDINRVKKPILTLNIDSLQKEGNLYGATIIYEHPPDKKGARLYNRTLFKVTYDPIKDDGEGTSLCSILVHKSLSGDWEMGLQDAIVAEYIGRPETVEECHEIAIKLAMYYNTRVLYENNIPDFGRYCRRTHRTHLLQAAPWEAITKSLKHRPGRKYDAGVTMSGPLNTQCELLIKQWLLESDGMVDEKPITNIDKIYSLRLLQELIHYNRKGNFDHVSSLKVLVLWLFQEQEVPVAEARQADYRRPAMNFVRDRMTETRQKNVFYKF